MALDQQVMRETMQPTNVELIDGELESLERTVFKGDVEAALMETQTRLEETYKELNRVGLQQYQGVLGQILGYLSDLGVIDGSKRLKGKRNNIVRAATRIESQMRKARKQVEGANKDYAQCSQTLWDANRVMNGYEAKIDSFHALLEQKRQELAKAQNIGDANDRSYLQLPIEIGKIETDIVTAEYKLGRAASKVVSCDRRLDTIDYKRKAAMQQMGVLGNMTNTLEAVLDIADSSFGEGISPLDTLKALNYAAKTVKEIGEYTEIIKDRRVEIQGTMNELPKLLEDQFEFGKYTNGEVVTIEADRTVADAKKAVERRLHGTY